MNNTTTTGTNRGTAEKAAWWAVFGLLTFAIFVMVGLWN